MFVQAIIPLLAYGMGYDGVNWMGYTGSDINVSNANNLTDDQIQALGIDESIATDSGLSWKSFGLISLIGTMIKSIFWIYPTINGLLFVPSPTDVTSNAFAPFLVLVQIGIYIVYAFALYELVTGRQVDT